MGFWDAFLASTGKTPSATPGYDDGSGRVQALGTPGLQPSGSPDYQSTFMSIVGTGLATPDALLAKEQELAAQGIKVLRNTAGVAGKVQLPTGEIVDVIQSAGTGGGVAPFTWQRGRGGPTGEGGKPLPGNQFYGQTGPTMGSLAGAMRGTMNGGTDYAARLPALEKTPGYQFRLNQGIQALDRSASAKGTLLNGGYQKDLMEFAQGLASTEFDREFGRNSSLADLGMRAAGAQGAYGTSYGDQITNLTTGAGNAQAAGTAASGNAWGGTLQGLGSLGMQAGLYNWLRPQQPMGGGGGGW
jgi:hypothetical protein